jgi:hypothetical protein
MARDVLIGPETSMFWILTKETNNDWIFGQAEYRRLQDNGRKLFNGAKWLEKGIHMEVAQKVQNCQRMVKNI